MYFFAEAVDLRRLDQRRARPASGPRARAPSGCARDLLVHQRLGEPRLVPFVVAVAAVADQVDQEVPLEPRAIGERQPRRLDAGLRVVGVDVDDRDLEAARQPARVRRAERILGGGGEPELVVGDDVDRAAGRVAGQPAQVQRLGDHALARERRVAVDQDRHAPAPDRTAARRRRRRSCRPRGPCPRPPGRPPRDGSGSAASRRPGRAARRRESRAARRRGTSRRRSTTCPRGSSRDTGSLNSARICAYGLFSTCAITFSRPRCAMPIRMLRMPDFGRLADHLVQHRDEHVEPFDREARLARKGALQEPLERFDLRQPIEQLDRIDRIGGGAEAAALPPPGAASRARPARTRARCRSRRSSSRSRRSAAIAS